VEDDLLNSCRQDCPIFHSNSHYDYDQKICTCDAGFIMDEDLNQCVVDCAISKPNSHFVFDPNTALGNCKCNRGYQEATSGNCIWHDLTKTTSCGVLYENDPREDIVGDEDQHTIGCVIEDEEEFKSMPLSWKKSTVPHKCDGTDVMNDSTGHFFVREGCKIELFSDFYFKGEELSYTGRSLGRTYTGDGFYTVIGKLAGSVSSVRCTC